MVVRKKSNGSRKQENIVGKTLLRKHRVLTVNDKAICLIVRAGRILEILQSDWFWERAEFSDLAACPLSAEKPLIGCLFRRY